MLVAGLEWHVLWEWFVYKLVVYCLVFEMIVFLRASSAGVFDKLIEAKTRAT